MKTLPACIGRLASTNANYVFLRAFVWIQMRGVYSWIFLPLLDNWTSYTGSIVARALLGLLLLKHSLFGSSCIFETGLKCRCPESEGIKRFFRSFNIGISTSAVRWLAYISTIIWFNDAFYCCDLAAVLNSRYVCCASDEVKKKKHSLRKEE